ncbi:MarR family transcriptional regulator [Kribbella jejuensis]
MIDTVSDAEVVEQASLALFELTLKALSASRQLSVLQLRVLLAIEQHGPVNLGDVADQLDLSKPSASRLVARLVDDGLILRRIPETDRRQVELAVSAKGRRVLGSLHRGRQRKIGDVLDAMSPDSSEALIQGLLSFAEAATTTARR